MPVELNGGTLYVRSGSTGPATWTGNFTLNSNSFVNVNFQTLTISGNISGAGGFTKTGTNTLTLTGLNTYSGDTVVSLGTLLLSNATGYALSSTNVNIATNATLTIAANEQLAPYTVLSMSNSATRLQLNGFTQTIAAVTTPGAGGNVIIQPIESGTAAGTASTLIISSDTANSFFDGYLRDRGGAIGVIKNGAATLTLVGANIIFTGGLLVENGFVVLSNTTAFGSAATINGGRLLLATATAMNNKNITNNVANGLGFLGGAAFTIGGLNGAGAIALTNDTGSAVALTVGGGNNNGTYSGVLSGPGSLTKAGTGLQILSGSNTFSGNVAINGGTLSVGFISDTVASGISTGALLSFNAGTLRYTGLGDSTTRTITNIGAATFDIADFAANLTLAGDIRGAGGITKTGSGTLTFSNNTTYIAGALNVSYGTLVMNGSTYTSTNTSTGDGVGNVTGSFGRLVITNNAVLNKTAQSLWLGYVAGSTGIVEMSSGSLRASGIYLGNNAGVGAFYQNGGTAYCVGEFDIGYQNGGYGFYQMTSGVLSNTSWFQLGRNSSMGLLYQSGGFITNTTSGLLIGNTVSTGVVYMTGGAMVVPAITFTYTAGSRGELNIADAASLTALGNLVMNRTTGTIGTNIVNLLGGTLQVNQVGKGATGGLAIFNFQGGTLRAGANNATFMQGLDQANVYDGGAVIDTGTNTITIAQPLLAPAGSGVTNVLFNVGSLTGYIGAPYVGISGTGTGATAVALFDYTKGAVTGIVVTSPGVNYTGTPTVTLTGGGGTNATFDTVLGVNQSGGLTKNGTGTLVLSGASTYDGLTVVNDGLLIASNATALGSTVGDTVVSNGAALRIAGNGIAIAEALRIRGDGVNFNGALGAGGSTNIWGGAITLEGNARISGNGSLIITGGITGANFNLRLQSGVTITNTPINLGTGDLLVNGATAETRISVGGNTWRNTYVDWGGRLALGGHDLLPATSILYLGSGNGAGDSNGVFNLNGFNQTFAGLASGTGNLYPTTFTVTNSGAAATLTINQVSNTAYLGAIRGPLTLAKGGTGSLMLSNANSYTGGTLLNAGTVTAARSDALGTGLVTFNGGALAASANVTLPNTVNLAQNGVFDTAGNTLTLNGAITNSGSLIKVGAGTLELAKASTYTGATIISNGTLRLVAPPSTPVAGALYWLDAANGGSVALTASNTVSQWNDLTANGLNFAQAIGANQPLYVTNALNGLAVIRFDGSNDQLTLGATTTPQSVFILNKPNAYGNLNGVWGASTPSDKGIRMNNTNTWAYPGDGNDFANLAGSVIYVNGVATNNFGSLGTAHLLEALRSAPYASYVTNQIGGYFGGRFYNGDVGEVLVYTNSLTAIDRQWNEAYLMFKWLGIGGVDILPTATAVQIAGGATLDLGGVQQTIGSLSGSGTVTNNSATAITFTIAPAAGSTTFDGAIVGDNLSLRKLGAGTQVLAGSNTFSGATLIQAGTLAINGYHPNSAVTVTSGGTLAGTGTISSSVTVDGGGLSPGSSSTGTLTVASLTLTNNPLLYFELGPTNASDLVVVTGALSLEGMATNWFVLSAVAGFDIGTYTLFQAGSIQGQLSAVTNFTNIAGKEGYLFLEGSNVRLEVIPEPGAGALVAAGLLALMLLRRRPHAR